MLESFLQKKKKNQKKILFLSKDITGSRGVQFDHIKHANPFVLHCVTIALHKIFTAGQITVGSEVCLARITLKNSEREETDLSLFFRIAITRAKFN